MLKTQCFTRNAAQDSATKNSALRIEKLHTNEKKIDIFTLDESFPGKFPWLKDPRTKKNCVSTFVACTLVGTCWPNVHSNTVPKIISLKTL